MMNNFEYSIIFRNEGSNFYSIPVTVFADTLDDAVEKALKVLPQDDNYNWEIDFDNVVITEVN